jgi:RNA polymerase sigma-70 factor (ECF subfamily)
MSLIEQIKAGDKIAVLAFYRQYAPKIQLYLERRLNKEDAHEVLNDVFLDALDELPFLKHQDNILGWLYRIARNKTIDTYRKKKLKSVLFSQIPYLEFAAKEMHQPEFIMEKERIRQKIEHAMQMISSKSAMILRMHYEDGMRVKEISFVLNLSFKATESLLFRARRQFMKAYAIS